MFRFYRICLFFFFLSTFGLLVSCLQDKECRFDGDCAAAGARCVSGRCAMQERSSVEATPPDVRARKVECQDGHEKSCYSGSAVIQGICQKGIQVCAGGKWGPCQGEVLPKEKEACNALDDNCNGTVDEGCNCKPSEEKDCYTGPEGTDGKGTCKRGRQVCGSQGQWGKCEGSVSPAKEECNDKDDNCNGKIDEGLFQECYEGPANTAGVGLCQKGKKLCENGRYSTCVGQVQPVRERCKNSKDDDCDGTVDEGSGRALAFSGARQSVTIPHNNVLNLSGSFTIELWYRFEGVGSKPLMILVNKHQYNENSSGYQLKIQNPNNECAFSWWKGNTGGLLTFGACPVKRWAHLALVYDQTLQQYSFYIDGKRVKSAQLQQPLGIGGNTFPLVLGSETGSSGSADYRGQMASVRLSRSARYSGTSFSPACTFTNDSQTTGLWNLDDGAGSRVRDLSSLRLNGTLNGPVWESGRRCNQAKPNEGCQ